MSVCCSCGHPAKDTYAVDPATGQPTAERRWCVDCYERESAQYARERHIPEKKDGVHAK